MKDLWHYYGELPNPDTLMSFHCILHQLNLCVKSALLSGTLNGVIGIVKYIQANPMRHRQFRQMLQNDDEIFNVDLPYHSKVRWWSQEQVLEKFYLCKNKLSIFSKTKIYLANCQNKFFAKMQLFCAM